MDTVSRSRLLGMEVLRDDASVAGFVTQLWLSPITRKVVVLGVRSDTSGPVYWPISDSIRVEHVVIIPRSLQPITLDPAACVSLYGSRLSNPPTSLPGSAYVSDFQFDLASGIVSGITVATLRLNVPLNPLLGIPGLTKHTELANIGLSSLNAITVTIGAPTPLPEPAPETIVVAEPPKPEPFSPAAPTTATAETLPESPEPEETTSPSELIPLLPAPQPATGAPLMPRFNIKAGQPLRSTFSVKRHGQVPKPLRPTLRGGGFAKPRVR